MRNQTADGRIQVGSVVLVRGDARNSQQYAEFPYCDTVRGVITQTILLEPYAPNEQVEALILTKRSWCRAADVMEVVSQ